MYFIKLPTNELQHLREINPMQRYIFTCAKLRHRFKESLRFSYCCMSTTVLQVYFVFIFLPKHPYFSHQTLRRFTWKIKTKNFKLCIVILSFWGGCGGLHISLCDFFYFRFYAIIIMIVWDAEVCLQK